MQTLCNLNIRKFFENKRNIKLLQFVISNTQNSDLECLSIIACLAQSFLLATQSFIRLKYKLSNKKLQGIFQIFSITKYLVGAVSYYRKYPNLERTQVETISDLNYLVCILFER